MKPIEFGKRGHYGAYTNPRKNEISELMNLLIDVYNLRINTFTTFEEQVKFADKIDKQLVNLGNELTSIKLLELKDIKDNYIKEHKSQELYRSVNFADRKPKLSANEYFYMVYSEGGWVYARKSGYLGHMEQHMKEHPEHILYWLEPESEWFVELYETGNISG